MISELAIHIALHYLRSNILQDWRFWHCLNGEKQDARTTAKFRALGVTRGIPALILLGPDGRARFVEIKREDGSLTEDQEAFMLWCIRHGIPHSVVRNLSDATRLFEFWKCVASKEAAHDAQS